jgi:hypothetical protein
MGNAVHWLRLKTYPFHVKASMPGINLSYWGAFIAFVGTEPIDTMVVRFLVCYAALFF